jgi:hemoglobin
MFERAGGAERLRAVLTDFYDRVFADTMIGFLFRGKERARLIEKELEFTLGTMGATVPYTGRPLDRAHASSPILGGHFDRRQQILRETCDDHGLPPEVRDFWLAHNETLRTLVVGQSGSECDHDAVHRKLGG